MHYSYVNRAFNFLFNLFGDFTLHSFKKNPPLFNCIMMDFFRIKFFQILFNFP